MKSGLKLKFHLAIDFTNSSFAEHNNTDERPYEETIRALGRIMQNFDDDGKIPAYAYCEPDKFWPLLSEKGEPEVGLEELLNVYYDWVDEHEFEEGEVKIQPLIRHFVADLQGSFKGEADEYHVLIL